MVMTKSFSQQGWSNQAAAGPLSEAPRRISRTRAVTPKGV
jgi:hypothetical protein